MLNPDGAVVVDPRNWENLHSDHRVVQIADQAVTRGERRCTVVYAWEIPKRSTKSTLPTWSSSSTTASCWSRTSTRSGSVPLRTVDELRRRLQLAGFREIDTDFDEGMDRYSFVALA